MEDKNIQNQGDKAVNSEIIKKTIAEIWNKNKKLCKAVISILIVAAVIGASVLVASSDAVRPKLLNAVIPDKIGGDDSFSIVFYKELKEDYNGSGKLNDYFDMFNYYYYPDNDKSNEKVYLDETGIYDEGNGAYTIDVPLNFMAAAAQKGAKMVQALKIIAVILVVVCIALIIYAWYRADKKQYEKDKKAPRKRKTKNN